MAKEKTRALPSYKQQKVRSLPRPPLRCFYALWPIRPKAQFPNFARKTPNSSPGCARPRKAHAGRVSLGHKRSPELLRRKCAPLHLLPPLPDGSPPPPRLTWCTKTSTGDSRATPSLVVMERKPKPIRTLNHLQIPAPCKSGWLSSSGLGESPLGSSSPALAQPPRSIHAVHQSRRVPGRLLPLAGFPIGRRARWGRPATRRPPDG